ncbi:MAG: hypothetical protein ACJA1H_000992 [Glaciecola sp.]|jgi:hypothetical protein
MKFKFLIISYFTLGYCFAQKTIKPLGFTEDSISINTNIKLHDAVSFKNVVITFEEVLIDSRCPKEANCVRAGEAKILLSIFEDGVFLKKKEVTIDAEGYVFKNTNMFYKMKNYEIYATELYPYPQAKEKTKEESYNANFFVMRNYRQ